MSTFIIAEAGSTHCGRMDYALELIEKAKEAGCDAVKFQVFSDKLYAPNTPDFGGYKDINSLMASLVLPREWLPVLKARCDNIGIEFMATPFDEEAIKLLVDLGVKRLKIAAFESSDPRFLRMCGETKLPLIISLGAEALEAWEVFKILRDDRLPLGEDDPEVTFLHCVSKYPTPPEDACLGEIGYMAHDELAMWNVGYSDHTTDVFTPSLAVALGASVIEKHFTLSRQLDNPDAPHSLEPHELKEMVSLIRETEKKLGLKWDKTRSTELNECSRSVFAVKDLKDGDILTLENITTARPFLGGNIHASSYYNIIGMRVIGDVKAGEALKNVRH